jgi:hypothetical protein
MTDPVRRCQCRAAPVARAAHAQFCETVLVGTMMAAGIAGAAWLMLNLAV